MFGPSDADTAGKGLDKLAPLTFDPKRVTQFRNSPTVHHINYFRQPETANALHSLL
jgi:hypothetical protein